MSLDLARFTAEPPHYGWSTGLRPTPSSLPYGEPGPEPARGLHLAVCRDGPPVGHVVVNPWRGVAGIYAMGVADAHGAGESAGRW